MLGIPRRYVFTHPVQVAAHLAAHPFEVLTRLHEEYVDRREWSRPRCQYESVDHWEQWLHDHLGVEWPCPFVSEFWDLWPRITGELEARGVRAGPESFKDSNDGDAGLVRTLWCLTRHLRPNQVVETGVAHGVTSRVILEALERNGRGHLWSIDLPPVERVWQQHVGIAVGDRYADRWSYLEGTSRRRLPKLLAQLGEIDLFVHDSLHSERNVRFELDRAWAALRPGGALVVDDIDANWGFQSFTHAFEGHESVICEAEPLHPDARRFNQKGLFGIIMKGVAASVSAP
jgi:hypothetical protein